MLGRVENADSKMTFLVTTDTAKYVRTASAGQSITQSKFISDVLERHGRVESLDIGSLRSTIQGISECDSLTSDDLDHFTGMILSIFGIQKGE